MKYIIAKSANFPLIRIFIILIAAALLAGSISTGKEIIHKSNVKEVAADIAKYTHAFNSFKSRYHALPGDMINASSYWNNCRSNIAECNGDGNGTISSLEGDRTTESALAWQHLSLSGIIADGNYSGNLISGYYIPGENIPKSSYVDSGYIISDKIAYHSATNSSHFIKLGQMSDWQFNSPAATLTDAAALDNKLDDGIASRGDILAYSNPEQGCLQNYSRDILIDKSPAHYANEISNDNSCNIYFRLN